MPARGHRCARRLRLAAGVAVQLKSATAGRTLEVWLQLGAGQGRRVPPRAYGVDLCRQFELGLVRLATKLGQVSVAVSVRVNCDYSGWSMVTLRV